MRERSFQQYQRSYMVFHYFEMDQLKVNIEYCSKNYMQLILNEFTVKPNIHQSFEEVPNKTFKNQVSAA